MEINFKAFWCVVMVITFCYQTQADNLLRIYIKSEGCDDKNITGCGYAFIRVNGVEYSKKRRGYNVVVVNADTGVVESSATFDTYADDNAAGKLTYHLRSIKSRKLVLVAIQDEGSNKMSDAAYNELKKLGAVNPKKEFRGSYALLGWSGPGELDAITQVQRDRYQGPSIISKVLTSPL